MMQVLKAVLVFFVSSQVMASTLDFRKVPSDKLLVCDGSDLINKQFATRLYYSPNKTITDDKKDLFYALVDTTKSEHYEFLAASFVRKSIPDKETLTTILKNQVGWVMNDSQILQVASQNANYPLSLILGKNMHEKESDGTDYILSITGFDGGKDKTGKSIEITMSALYTKPSANSSGTAQLASFSYQLCNLAPLTELFTEDVPSTPVKK